MLQFPCKAMASAPFKEQPGNLLKYDTAAIEDLVRQYSGPLFAASLAMGFSEADAEDLVQDTFVSFLGATGRFEGRSTVKTYLFGILYNKASAVWRLRRRETPFDEAEPDIEWRFDARGMWARPPQGPEDAALSGEVAAWIKRCSENLTLPQRSAFFMREVEGEKTESLCNILGVSPTNLRVLFFRARIKLRECLEKNWLNKT